LLGSPSIRKRCPRRCSWARDRAISSACIAACCQTATALINELAEAAHANQLSGALGRWERLDLISIDELGYVRLAETPCAS